MRSRPGVSLTELIVALGIFSVLMATSLGFYRQQGRAFTSGNERMTVMQNLRYGISSIEQHLRTTGINVPTKQPVVVYAGENVFSFNADYASNLASDVFAVYRTPGLPASAVSAVTKARRFTIPGTSFAYPDTAYSDGAGNSAAETLTFFFASDSSTSRLDDFILYRQVNDGNAEIIARQLLRAGRPFFTYYTVIGEGPEGQVTELPSSSLPVAHTVPIHGTPADTGKVARADSIRAVRVSYAATNGLEGTSEAKREISRLIRLPNAGVALQQTCGNKPILGVTLAAVGIAETETTRGHVELAWNQATDEKTGEKDVIRYVLWRMESGGAVWGDPLVSIPPGATSYTYQDFTAVSGQLYRYALAAQDCTPQYSPLSVTGEVGW